MDAMLVIKSRNGYIVTPYTAEMPTPDLEEVSIATTVDSNAWEARGKTVADVLKAHFEPPETVTELKAA